MRCLVPCTGNELLLECRSFGLLQVFLTNNLYYVPVIYSVRRDRATEKREREKSFELHGPHYGLDYKTAAVSYTVTHLFVWRLFPCKLIWAGGQNYSCRSAQARGIHSSSNYQKNICQTSITPLSVNLQGGSHQTNNCVTVYDTAAVL